MIIKNPQLQVTQTMMTLHKNNFTASGLLKFIFRCKSCSYTEDDVNTGLIDKQLNFSKEQANSFGDNVSDINNVITNPKYDKQVMNDNDFFVYFTASFDNL